MKPITKCYKLAKAIPSGSKTKAKCKAVHAYFEAIRVMLRG